MDSMAVKGRKERARLCQYCTQGQESWSILYFKGRKDSVNTVQERGNLDSVNTVSQGRERESILCLKGRKGRELDLSRS